MDIEEAVKEHCTSTYRKFDDTNYIHRDIVTDFKAGAKWARKEMIEKLEHMASVSKYKGVIWNIIHELENLSK